jgi:hypothetical protein
MKALRLSGLQPRFVGAGGSGVYQMSGLPCPQCKGEHSETCNPCFGSGKEYLPAPVRTGVGLSFLCPCATCTPKRTGDRDKDFHLRVYVGFRNPLDGGPPVDPRDGAQWERTGDTFDTLTLWPSILSNPPHGCGWHGYVTNGDVTTC